MSLRLTSPGPVAGGATSGMSRRRALSGLAAAAVPATALLLGACGQEAPSPGAAASGRGGDMTGTFTFSVQNFQPTINIIDRAIPAFQKQHPAVTIKYTPVEFSAMATKVAQEIAAGSGHDGFHTYTGFWRGTDAANMMLPLTPVLFKKADLEQMFFANVLGAVWSKRPETYIMPFSVGVNGSMLLWNSELTQRDGVDPKTFTSLDQIAQGAVKLTRKSGPDWQQAGLLPSAQTNLVMRWIIDQGGAFYDEKTFKWTWQTAQAERAVQWLVDLYDKHGVAWKAKQAPAEVKDALGEQRAAMMFHGAYAISGYATSHKDTFPKLVDQPLPGFTPGKAPNYYEHEYSGYALSALLKPDDMRARVGAAFYRELLSPDSLIARANEYSGAILAKAIYSDPRFKDTTFGPIRAKLPEQVISKMLFMTMAVRPEQAQAYLDKVVNGETSLKSALAEMQQFFQTKEDEARQNMR
jgi:ABC-type glycerol-3-phosphate transport system substrate-binding protein